ncbi:MAG: FAD-binding oxidoreductase [Anaerolineae bacterium]|nr:FAD-binding oxidoreductase [Anaerolineae bacterium]
MTTSKQISRESLNALQARLQGAIIAPGDPGYDSARMAWNLSVQQFPAAVIMAADTADIAEAVRFARQAGLKVGVQATGHNVIRPADGSLLINTSQMAGVSVDAAARTARIEAGAQWGAVLPETQAAGLAPLLGSSPGVGAVAYTLGGGLGWLARKYGLAADTARSFEVVTADGRTLHVSQNENADLFWGLRGGGGGFALVTAMEIDLFPVTTIFGGNLVYPAALAGEVLRRYREWIGSLPLEFTTSVALMNLPPLPMVPEFLRGKSVIMVRGCHCGAPEEGQALLQPWLDWQAPVANLFRPMPFSDVAQVSNDPHDPVPGHTTGAWLRDLSDSVLDALVEYGVSNNGSSPLVSTEVRHVAGAMASGDRNAAAFPGRDQSFLLGAVGMAPTPELHARVVAFSNTFKRALQPHISGLYVNFVEGQEAREAAADSYPPETLQRLAALKAQYDPDHLLDYSYQFITGHDVA